MLTASRSGGGWRPPSAVETIDAMLDGAAQVGGEPSRRSSPICCGRAASADEARADFEHRSSDYYSLPADLAGGGPPRACCPTTSRPGSTPSRSTTPIGASRCVVTSRSGPGSPLTQKRITIGNEMGLGKSIEAIAALAHLAPEGRPTSSSSARPAWWSTGRARSRRAARSRPRRPTATAARPRSTSGARRAASPSPRSTGSTGWPAPPRSRCWSSTRPTTSRTRRPSGPRPPPPGVTRPGGCCS